MARTKRRYKSTESSRRVRQAIMGAKGDLDSQDEPNYVAPPDPGIRALMKTPQYKAAMLAIGKAAAEAAQDAAPVDSGDLKESIDYGLTDEGSVVVSVGVDYGVPVDQGTATHKAVPFLSGAALDVRV